ncbi:hypothetical protein GGR58DRAFT_496847 [Xylaria digitata]|nr:hypothetical protein GGR58DRAFT_496847 [Xylaria digitata]
MPPYKRVKPRKRRVRRAHFKIYAILCYNVVALIGWVCLLLRSLSRGSYPGLWEGRADLNFVTKLEAAAFIEVLHALLDVVRRPAPRRPKLGPYSDFITSLQICMRNVIIWGVLRPNVILSTRRVFQGCLIAWGGSDCLRYLYVITLLISGSKPVRRTWSRQLRYTASIFFYFFGFACELLLVAYASDASGSPAYRSFVFWGIVLFALQNFACHTMYFYRDIRYWG